MLALKIIMDGDGCWADLPEKKVINAMGNDTHVEVALLSGGMASGKASVAFRVEAPTGRL